MGGGLTSGMGNIFRKKSKERAEQKENQRVLDAEIESKKIEAEKDKEVALQRASQSIAEAVARRGVTAGEVGEFGVDEDEEVEKKKTVLGRG